MDYAAKIDKIIKLLTNYRSLIETKNKCGLFDSATLYELFAARICSIWFGQEFDNLNNGKANAAYVDLVSKDKTIYVQVTTVQDIPRKIKDTLSKITENKVQSSLKINRLYFFVLDNDSLKNVKDYSGEQRIGDIDFNKNENLITLERILEKAKQDSLFLEKLFSIVDDESDSIENLENLAKRVDESKKLLNLNIENKINGEYSIDRSALKNQIIADNNRFVSIQGIAGVGKSALCKELLEREERILYLRAEKFVRCTNINDLWNIDVDKVLYYLHGQKIVFFIDALEFIADGMSCNVDLLQALYLKASEYNNVYIYNTCRTVDSKRFVKLDQFFNIKIYLVETLRNEEINSISERYNVLKHLTENRNYKSLLDNPFYLNLIISRELNLQELENVSDFRDSIWNDIICCGDNDLKLTVKKIVLERAKNGLIGIDQEVLKGNELKKLLSNGIITVCSDDTIRLKYDIFEDICFEQIIDKLFKECKGIYENFFVELEQLGRCAYRRYQIWVENKLLIKKSGEMFFYKLLSNINENQIWSKYTVIGIIRSNYCKDFFRSYENVIVNEQLEYFVKLTNNHCFELNIVDDNDRIIGIRPIGYGRRELINLIVKHNKYCNEILEDEIGKLCLDYSQYSEIDNSTGINACVILENIVDKKIQEIEKAQIYANEKELVNYLKGIYILSPYAGNWIKKLWEYIISLYFDGGNYSRYLARQIMLFTLQNAACIRENSLVEEIVKIADVYWLNDPIIKKVEGIPCFYDSHNVNTDFGLSKMARNYNHEFSTPQNNGFLIYLINNNLWLALKWIIKLVNGAAEHYKNKYNDDVKKICLWNKDSKKKKTYYFANSFVQVGRIEYIVPELLGDSIYIFSKYLVEAYKSTDKNNLKCARELIEKVKEHILEKSNNVMLFNVILEIGVCLKEDMPAYAKELASSIEFVLADIAITIDKYPGYQNVLFSKKNASNMNKILDFDNRYVKKNDEVITLQDYLLECQFLVNDSIKTDINAMLDWMYSKYPNNQEYAKEHLNIQKMDLREQIAYKVDGNISVLAAQVEGAVKELTESQNNNLFHLDIVKYSELREKIKKTLIEIPCNIKGCMHVLQELCEFTSEELPQNILKKEIVDLSIHLLSQKDADLTVRKYICGILLNMLQDIIEKKIIFLCDPNIKVLFIQYDVLDDEILKCNIKQLMLKYLFYEGSNGIIIKIRNEVKTYLKENSKLAKVMFNTICNLAIDKMNEQKYIASVIYSCGDYQYIPNFSKPPYLNKIYFEEKGIPLYQNMEMELINQYLFKEDDFDARFININNAFIHVLSFAVDSGLSLEDKDYQYIINILFKYLVAVNSGRCDDREAIKFWCSNRIVQSLNWELTYGDNENQLMKILFEGIDFNLFSHKTINIYDEISNGYISRYLDEYKNQSIREKLENKIRLIEQKISLIDNKMVREELSVMLFLCGNFGFGADLNACATSFSFKNKMFLNELWSKYGRYHIKNFLTIIYQFHIEELLPEILPAVYKSLSGARINNHKLSEILPQLQWILIKFLRCAFMNFRDEIHGCDEYSRAYEGILEILGDEGVREAYVLLDEFRIH